MLGWAIGILWIGDPPMYHFSAWTKLDRGWLDWDTNTTRLPCKSGSCEITTVLDPVEKKGNNALLIPTISNSPFVGIMAECRKAINGDEDIPEEGVLVTFSNPFLDYSLAGTVSSVLTNESNPYALLQPGESYYNDAHKVRVTNLSKPGDAACTVLAQREVNPFPELYINQGPINERNLTINTSLLIFGTIMNCSVGRSTRLLRK